MGERGQGCASIGRRCLVCDNTVKVIEWSESERPQYLARDRNATPHNCNCARSRMKPEPITNSQYPRIAL